MISPNCPSQPTREHRARQGLAAGGFGSLGLASSASTTLPARFASGMFIGQHGSWNRRPHSGYKVIFVPFENGKPSGIPVEVLTGFLSADGEAFGRPVGVVLDHQGARLVADDVGNAIWRVTAQH